MGKPLQLFVFLGSLLTVNSKIIELNTLEDLGKLQSNYEAVGIFYYSHLQPSSLPFKSKLFFFLFVIQVEILKIAYPLYPEHSLY